MSCSQLALQSAFIRINIAVLPCLLAVLAAEMPSILLLLLRQGVGSECDLDYQGPLHKGEKWRHVWTPCLFVHQYSFSLGVANQASRAIVSLQEMHQNYRADWQLQRMPTLFIQILSLQVKYLLCKVNGNLMEGLLMDSTKESRLYAGTM